MWAVAVVQNVMMQIARVGETWKYFAVRWWSHTKSQLNREHDAKYYM